MKLCYTTYPNSKWTQYPNSKWTQYPSQNRGKPHRNGLKRSSCGNAANGYYFDLCESDDTRRSASIRNGKNDTDIGTQYDGQIH